jgi:hypothetical protein
MSLRRAVTQSFHRVPLRSHLATLPILLILASSVFVGVIQSARATSVPAVPNAAPAAASSPLWQPQGQTAQLVSALSPRVAGNDISNTARSTNWSGYADTGPTFSAISAQWTVPSVLPSQSSQYSSTWIGIDGDGNSSLIQTGTASQTENGTISYFDWYEILPAYAVEIASVTPGDQINATISQVVAGTWSITITDTTSGSVFSQQFPYSEPDSSAEWIVEAPTINGQQSTLADFTSERFTNIADTNTGTVGVTQTPIEMNNSGGSVIASPAAIANNAFTVTYDGPAPTPPPSLASTVTTVSVNPASTTAGGTVNYSASVTSAGGTPSGSVTFAVGSTSLCTAQLVGGSASCSATTAPVGTDAVIGTYGGSLSFATSSGSASLTVPPTSTHGYWLVGSDGGIFTFGSAPYHGSTGNLALQRPVVGISPTADRAGYWLVASDGGVFAFGDAGFYGSIPGLGIAPAGSPGSGAKLNAPIVGIVPSVDGGGYFMVASDGGVFAFGDAKFEGSCPGIGGCSGAAVAVTPDASGNGYWLVTATGHVYTFGDAAYYGAPGTQSTAVTSAVRTPDGKGYWILFANGTVDAYGDAIALGEPVGQTNAASAIFTTSDGDGYWVSSASGAVYAYGDAPNDGGLAGQKLNGSIVAASGF